MCSLSLATGIHSNTPSGCLTWWKELNSMFFPVFSVVYSTSVIVNLHSMFYEFGSLLLYFGVITKIWVA